MPAARRRGRRGRSGHGAVGIRRKDGARDVVADDEASVLQRFVGIPPQGPRHGTRGDHDGLLLGRENALAGRVAAHDDTAQLFAHEAAGPASARVARVREDQPVRQPGADDGVRQQARERRHEQVRQLAQRARRPRVDLQVWREPPARGGREFFESRKKHTCWFFLGGFVFGKNSARDRDGIKLGRWFQGREGGGWGVLLNSAKRDFLEKSTMRGVGMGGEETDRWNAFSL